MDDDPPFRPLMLETMPGKYRTIWSVEDAVMWSMTRMHPGRPLNVPSSGMTDPSKCWDNWSDDRQGRDVLPV